MLAIEVLLLSTCLTDGQPSAIATLLPAWLKSLWFPSLHLQAVIKPSPHTSWLEHPGFAPQPVPSCWLQSRLFPNTSPAHSRPGHNGSSIEDHQDAEAEYSTGQAGHVSPTSHAGVCSLARDQGHSSLYTPPDWGDLSVSLF